MGRLRKSRLPEFPTPSDQRYGHALGVAQLGGRHPSAKPWKGQGAGVFELVESFQGNAYRAIYTVRFQGYLYVLHAFQKKSPSGIRTAQSDIDLIHDRLIRARGHFETTQPITPKDQAKDHDQ